MARRFYLLPIILFWVTMNVLLWRSEFTGHADRGSEIPADLVWGRILTAPDDSGLDIYRRGQKIGFCRWRVNVGEERKTGRILTEELQPEGQVRNLTGYTLDVESNFMFEEAGRRMRVEFHGEFEANHAWKTLALQVLVRPSTWEVRARRSDRTFTLSIDEGGGAWERTFDFSDLQDPSRLLLELGYPMPPDLFSPGAEPPNGQKTGGTSLGLSWTARNDWLRIGQTRLRVYRLETTFVEGYRATIFVSRVGELLRVELPGDILLVNDALIM
jgi:hypothetical protein